MAERKFVYLADQKQEFLRQIARETDLTPISWSDAKHKPISRDYPALFYFPWPSKLPEGTCALWRGDKDQPELSQPGGGYKSAGKYRDDNPESISLFFRMEGSALNMCNATDKWKSGWSQNGWRLGCDGNDGPLALEPICFGTGIFRELFSRQTLFESMVGELPRQKYVSEYLQSLGAIVTTQTRHGEAERVVYESTNIIYGDSYGELEQLIRRRDDRTFLDLYLQVLNHEGERLIPSGTDPNVWYNKGRNFFETYRGHPSSATSGSLCKAWTQHIDQNGLWDKPPQTPEELLERVEYLLGNTIIDPHPELRRTKYDHKFHLGEDQPTTPRLHIVSNE